MTDCDRLLAALSDGREHSASELYGLHMIVHSRISDLRRRGHTISVRRTGRGAPNVWYKLERTASAAADWHPGPGVDRQARADTRVVNQHGDIRATHLSEPVTLRLFEAA